MYVITWWGLLQKGDATEPRDSFQANEVIQCLEVFQAQGQDGIFVFWKWINTLQGY